MNAAWLAYRALAPALGSVAPWARFLAPRDERPLWHERMGRVHLAEGVHTWIHAASLGEAVGVPPLVERLLTLQPDARLCLSATTRTGRARLARLGLPVSLAPIDTPQAARRFFAGVRPRRLILLETELWPCWLLRARAEGIPVAVVSARLSERSLRGYRRLGAPLRDLVAGLAGVVCQTAEDEGRWRALGSPDGRTVVAGNLKHDALPAAASDRAVARSAAGLDPARPVLVLGSVRPGEARLLARAWRELPAALRARWQVVAVPRHARATRDLVGEAAEEGVCAADADAPGEGRWRWDDRAGVLAGYYAAADVAVVGGSLLPYGGHNPMEPAACGAAVVVGAHHASQLDAVRTLERFGAVSVARDPAELAAALRDLLGDSALRAARAGAALAAVASRHGAARRTVARLVEWKLWPVA